MKQMEQMKQQWEQTEQWDPQMGLKLRSLQEEQWHKIKDYENYEVSTEGQVFNTKTCRMLKPGYTCNYATVTLYKNGKAKNYYIHQLVAEAFLKKKHKSLKRVIHINGIKTDNRLENLRWEKAPQKA